jgi:HSP20 family protein
MNLIRYNPKSLDLLNVDRFFDDLLDSSFFGSSASVPAVDVRETEEAYLMEIDLPGLTEKDVEVKLDNSLLTISSKKEEKKEQKSNGYILKERSASEFRRSFVIPEEVDREKITAAFTNGVLSMSFPKVPAAKPRTIEVRKA